MKARERGKCGIGRARGMIVPLLAVACTSVCAAEPPALLDLTVPSQFDYQPPEPRIIAESPAEAHDRIVRTRVAVDTESDALQPAFVLATDSAEAPDLFRFAGSDGTTQTVAIRAKDIALDAGLLDVTASFAQQSVADDVTVERLMEPGAFEAESVSTLYTGAKGLWFKHLSFAAAAAVSETRATANAAFREVEPGLAIHEQNASALWLSARADFGDTKDLRWTIVGQLGDVADEFRSAAAARARPEGAVPIAGERAYAMTRLTVGDVALSSAASSLTREDYAVTSRRVTVSHDWGTASLVERNLTRAATQSETYAAGIAAELYPTGIFTGASFLPSLVSIDWRRQQDTGLTIVAERRTVTAIDAAWSNALGETVLSYWQSAPDTASTGDSDSLVDGSHRLTWSDWRLTGGVTHMAFRSSTATDQGFGAYGSLAFRPERWLHIECSIEHKKNETLEALEEGPLALEGLGLRFAVDAAPLLREAFGVAVTARFEYRQTLDRYSVAAEVDETHNAAVAATFAASL